MGNRRSVDYQLRPDRDLTILIPARAGSKRVPGKNTRLLGGKPLYQWTLGAAIDANVAKIIVSTDDFLWLPCGVGYTIQQHHRKEEHATDTATDFSWVYDCLPLIQTEYFCILRPTSPFRTASTIRRAYAALVGSRAHSVRAVERVHHPHPAKMWEFVPGSKLMRPIMVGSHPDGTYWHSSPTQSLPPVYKQNSSIEIAQTWVIEGTKTISGYHIAPFLTEPLEGFSIDTENDWREAERLLPEFLGEDVGYGHAV
jgi:CMP-N,N'-diacetyllegionaminic acid synthase